MIWSAEIAMLTRPRVSASGRVAVSQVDNSSACGAPLNGAIGTPDIPFIIRHWSRIGLNDSIAGGGDSRYASGLLGQKSSMITPCGIYMNPRRTGGGAGLPSAAQLRESMNGRARATPAPFSMVRRSTRESFFIDFSL